MRIGVYPGSFDPITVGHLEIIKRASNLVDLLYVTVTKNVNKDSIFTIEERVDMVKRATKDVGNVEVESFDGLTVDYAKEKGANVIFRGLRAVTDFEYELQFAQINHKLNPEVDTMFLTANVEYTYLSSSIVREIASYHGEIKDFVPECILDDVLEKFK